MTKKAVILDDFEHGDLQKYQLNHHFVSSYDISISNEQAIQGTVSLKVDYHFGGWEKGNGAMYVKFQDHLVADERPLKFGLWVYGDGRSPWLRATFEDGAGEIKTVSLTEKNIDWFGWKYLDIEIGKNWFMPLRLHQIYAVEVDKTHRGNQNYSGTFYIDALQFVYVDDVDLKGPVFHDISPVQDIIYQKSFTFSAFVFDEMSGVDTESIIVKLNGEQMDHHYNEETGKISYPFQDLTEGTYHITTTANDRVGNRSTPGIAKKLTVDLSPDVEKPIISNITPTERAVIHTETPRITFHMIDLKSGVEKEDIHVMVDGNKLDITYDEATGWCYAIPSRKLDSGDHTFTIIATDRAGNTLGPIEKKFTIRSLPQPSKNDAHRLTIIPDTHSSEYTKLAFQHASTEASDVILHMGDMVDEATEHEFDNLAKNAHIIRNHVLFTTPGNHESFLNNLDLYIHQFGSPTYHFEYGDLLVIVLNSAYEQSIMASDSTQFAYLEQVLHSHQKSNVVIATHVPSKDPFGTAHEMRRDDVAVLEKILSNYKKIEKHVNITVLFGHLHVLHQWEKDDVQYIITGNGARKGYVDHQRGNILGYGLLHVTDNGISYEYKPYVDMIYLTDETGISISKLQLKKGTKRKLLVHGEVNKLQTKYCVNLSPFDLIEKKWITHDEKVAKIDYNGVLKAIERGKTSIKVQIYNNWTELDIEVI